MLRRITNRRKIRLAHNALVKVFQHCDPFNRPFSSHIQRKAILCETASNIPNREQFTALCKAAGSIGEETAFVFGCGNKSTSFWKRGKREYWELSLDLESYDDYGYGQYTSAGDQFAQYSVLEHVIISPKGSWGILTSYEDHAVMGGSESFMAAFENNYHDFAIDLKRFYELWQYNLHNFHSKIGWIKGLLENVYGSDLPVEAPVELLGP